MKPIFVLLAVLLIISASPATYVEATPATGAACDRDTQCLSGRCIPNSDAVRDFGMAGFCSQGLVMQIDDMAKGQEVLPGRIYLPEEGNIAVIACSGEVVINNLPKIQAKTMCFDDIISGPVIAPGCIVLFPKGSTTTFQCKE